MLRMNLSAKKIFEAPDLLCFMKFHTWPLNCSSHELPPPEPGFVAADGIMIMIHVISNLIGVTVQHHLESPPADVFPAHELEGQL